MTPSAWRVLRVIIRVFLVGFIVVWLYSIVGWLATSPGFEPVNVLIMGVISASLWLLERASRSTTSQVRFSIIESEVSLSNGGIKETQGQFSLDPELTINCSAKICTHNPSQPASVKFIVASIAPDFLNTCLSGGQNPESLNVTVGYRENPNWASINLGNPFSVVSGDRNTDVSVKISLAVKEIESNFGAVALLKSMTVIFKAEFQATKRLVMLDPVRLDLAPIHKSIENNFITKVPKYQVGSTQALDTKQLVQALKRYWVGKD